MADYNDPAFWNDVAARAERVRAIPADIAVRAAAETSRMPSPTIASYPGGWHSATIHATSAATGVTRVVSVRWRTQRHQCHGQTWGVADGEHLPCYVDSTHGDLRSLISQCGNCGSVKAWRFTEKPA